MTLAIMQPYFFPYIGYFQLIKASDKFIFYDDVNFIKNGWINRNRILINSKPTYLTIQLKEASSYKLIKDIEFSGTHDKIKKSVELAYKKAPFFCKAMNVIEQSLDIDTDKVSDLAVSSVRSVCNYLGLNIQFELSSTRYSSTKRLGKEERIIEICKLNGASIYFNSIGGVTLYSKELFKSEGINICFIKPDEISYSQYSTDFVPWLSIIDVLMFNSIKDINNMLTKFKLI
jgi:hypothetical protein